MGNKFKRDKITANKKERQSQTVWPDVRATAQNLSPPEDTTGIFISRPGVRV